MRRSAPQMRWWKDTARTVTAPRPAHEPRRIDQRARGTRPASFGDTLRDKPGHTIVRFSGAPMPIVVEAPSDAGLIRVSADVAPARDWSGGLSDRLLLRNVTQRRAAFTRRGNTVIVEARLPASPGDGAIAEAAGALVEARHGVGTRSHGSDRAKS